MKVFVNSICSATSFLVEVSPNESVWDLKDKIEKIEDVKPEDQALSYSTKPLLDFQKLKDYGINQYSNLQLNVRLRGGGKERIKPIPVASSDTNAQSDKKPKSHNVDLEGVIQEIRKPENLLPSGYSNLTELQNFYNAEKKKKLKKIESKIQGYFYHSRSLTSVAIANCTEYFATGSEDGCIKLVNCSYYQVFQNFQNVHKSSVVAMAFSEDDKYLVSGSDDMTIKMINLESMQVYNHFQNVFSRPVLSIRFLKNSQNVVVGFNQGISVFDLSTGRVTSNLEGSEEAISSDGEYVACVLNDRNIKLFGAGPPQIIYAFNESDENTTALTISPDKKYIVSGCKRGSLKMFSTSRKETDYNFGKVHDGLICVVVVSQDNNYIITGSDDTFVKVFDIQTKRQIYLCENSFGSIVNSIAISNDNQYIVVGCSNRSFRIYPFEDQKKCQNMNDAYYNTYYSIAPLSKRFFLTSTYDKVIRIYDSEEKKESGRIPVLDNSKSKCLCVSKDEKFVIIGTDNGSLIKVDYETKEQAYFLETAHESNKYLINRDKKLEPIIKVTLSHDDKWIITASNDLSIKIFEIQTKNLVHCFIKPHENREITALVITVDNKHIISGCKGGFIKVFDITSKKEIHTFDKIHENYVSSILVTKNNKRIISASADGSLKIIDNKTKQIIYSYDNVHNKFSGGITSIALYNQDKYIITAGAGQDMVVIDIETNHEVYRINKKTYSAVESTTVIDDKFLIYCCSTDKIPIKLYSLPYCGDEHFECYPSISPFISAQGYETAILNKTDDPHFLQTYQDIYILPYNWTILHLLALFDHESLTKILPYSEMKVAFLVDKYGKTPLHYVLAHEKIDFPSVNYILEYILDYLEDNYNTKQHHCQEIMNSITNLIPFIISKTSPSLIYRFLKACWRPIPSLHGQTLPRFGETVQRYTFSEVPVLRPQTMSKIYKEGQDLVAFEILTPNLDYNALSDDMVNLTLTLNDIKDEEIFKSQAISHLISHLWKKSKKFHLIMGIIFSALMILISTDIIQGERLLPLEISITVLAAFFLLSEGIQMIVLRKRYLLNFWNWTDMIFFLLVIVLMILSFVEYDDSLVTGWLFSIVIITGYTRWISYLQLFEATRSLIHLILVVLKDMWAFLVIVFFIIVGFALIFLEFDRSQTYLDHFYATYNLLYGAFDASSYIPSQKILLALILFLLPVLLLNLLISIMGDSYEKVQEKKILTNAQTRLEMIMESTIIMRTLFKKKKQNKGYLLYCGSKAMEEEDSESVQWEGRINLLKRMLKQGQQKVDKVDGKIQKVEERVVLLEQDVKELKRNVSQNHQEIMTAIKALSKN